MFRLKRASAVRRVDRLTREELVSQLQRLQAEFDNYRKRAEKERAQAGEQAQRELARSLLAAYEGLQRMERALPESANDEDPVVSGFRAVAREFRDAFFRAGLAPMDALGRPFDPELHEAIGVVSAPPGVPDGAVAEVVQEGYYFNGVALRAARVVVARSEPFRNIEVQA